MHTSGFIPYAHYDGMEQWPYPASDRSSAIARLRRLQHRPSFVVAECDFVRFAFVGGKMLPLRASFSSTWLSPRPTFLRT